MKKNQNTFGCADQRCYAHFHYHKNEICINLSISICTRSFGCHVNREISNWLMFVGQTVSDPDVSRDMKSSETK